MMQVYILKVYWCAQIFLGELMILSPEDSDLDGPTAVDRTAPEGLLFHYANQAKPLATPTHHASIHRLVDQAFQFAHFV